MSDTNILGSAPLTSTKPSASSRGSRVSVCLTVYNDVAALEDTVNSILGQTLSGFEFIISDDCSKDGTWEKVQELAAKHPNIRAIQTPSNRKMCGNTNWAVRHATRDYVALLHHGDLYRPDLLEKWVDVMERYPSMGFVFNELVGKARDGSPRLNHKTEGSFFEEFTNGRRFLEDVLLKHWGCRVWGTTLFRRSCFEEVGGMREEFGYMADVDLWMRLAARWDVGYVNEPLISLQERHERPDDYPEEYKPTHFWPSKKLAYSIHAANISEYYAKSKLRRWWKMFQFRTKVSIETSKWLTWGLVGKRSQLILDSPKAECSWEFYPIRWYRTSLIWGKRVGII